MIYTVIWHGFEHGYHPIGDDDPTWWSLSVVADLWPLCLGHLMSGWAHLLTWQCILLSTCFHIGSIYGRLAAISFYLINSQNSFSRYWATLHPIRSSVRHANQLREYLQKPFSLEAYNFTRTSSPTLSTCRLIWRHCVLTGRISRERLKLRSCNFTHKRAGHNGTSFFRSAAAFT